MLAMVNSLIRNTRWKSNLYISNRIAGTPAEKKRINKNKFSKERMKETNNSNSAVLSITNVGGSHYSHHHHPNGMICMARLTCRTTMSRIDIYLNDSCCRRMATCFISTPLHPYMDSGPIMYSSLLLFCGCNHRTSITAETIKNYYVYRDSAWHDIHCATLRAFLLCFCGKA